uniref:Mitochondrial carrier protein n=1 Tax=Clastoptera arizonana TaxID=38151 RepID=A0A1B6EBD0_9HEMI
MMDENKKTGIPTKTVSAIAGGISGASTRFFCQPFDVIKIRFQFTAFDFLKDEMEKIYPDSNKRALVNFICGSLSGCAATLASFPFDVIRTRLVAQGNYKPIYSNMRIALYHMYLKEGPYSLWKGLTPSLIQSAPQAGTQFAFYKFFKGLFVKTYWLGKENEGEGDLFISGSLLAGSLAGLSSKCVTYPFDLARKRMQIQGFQRARTGFGKSFFCTGLISCLVTTVGGEGIIGLFKGLTPSLVKAIITNSLIFSIYEKTCQVLMLL